MNLLQISLAAARVNGNFTQEKLAKHLGVHKSTVQNWEKGKSSPDFFQVRKISELTHIPIDYIFLPGGLPKVNKN